MIILNEASSFTPAPDFQEAPWVPRGYTGITSVDERLEVCLGHGGLVLASGYTGSGKTVLAGQTAACAAITGRKVVYVSSEVPEDELLARLLSCTAPWPHQELRDHRLKLEPLPLGVLKMPVIPASARTDEFSALAVQPFRNLQCNLDFRHYPEFRVDPVAIVNEVVAELADDVGLLILDYLQIEERANVNVPGVAAEVLETLRSLAHEWGIPVFVFCQAKGPGEHQSKKDRKAGRSGGIADFPSAADIADVTIELTQPVARPTDRLTDISSYSSDRHFIVTRPGGREEWIPVLADFDYQRFSSRDQDAAEDMMDDWEFRQTVLRKSTRKGYIKFPRELWARLGEIKHVPSRAVYVAFAINADSKTGRLNWSEDALCKLFNVDRSVVRRALDHLSNAGLIRNLTVNGKTKECRVWEVVEYQEHFRNPEAQDYVVIARNLLDPRMACLRPDIGTFTAWLYLLFATRFSADEEGFLERGQWMCDYPGMARHLKLKPEKLEEVFALFEEQGRITRWVDPQWDYEVVMLPNYDQYQRQVPWQRMGN